MRAQLDGGIAQLVEQLTLNQWVVGSNPSASTILKSPENMAYRLFSGF